MTTDTKEVPSGDSQNAASGDSENTKTDNLAAKKEDMVSYDTYQKVLAEKKKRDAELAEYKADKKSREETELRQKEDWKKIIELRDKELTETKTKLSQLENGVLASVKLDSLLHKLSGSVSQEYFGLFDLDKIAIDPTTNKIDELSLNQYAKEVESKYSKIIEKKGSASIPNNAANGTASPSFDNWGSMSLADKKKYEKEYVQYLKSKM